MSDLALLLESWAEIQQKIKTQPAATCVFQEPDLIERSVRDFLTEDVERVVVDNKAAFERMKTIISRINTGGLLERATGQHQALLGTSTDL